MDLANIIAYYVSFDNTIHCDDTSTSVIGDSWTDFWLLMNSAY